MEEKTVIRCLKKAVHNEEGDLIERFNTLLKQASPTVKRKTFVLILDLLKEQNFTGY